MWTIGFIGTGNISSDVITGICNSSLNLSKIIVSPRNKNKAKILKKKFKNKILISKNNQDLIDKSDWVFLGVLPEVGEKILPNLKFKKNQLIISFLSTTNLKKLKQLIKSKVIIVRAIPMPPIAIGKGPVAIFPANKKVKSFFNKIGQVFEIKNENLSKNYWAISGTMALYYQMLTSLSDWLINNKINKIDAQKYVTSLYLALSNLAYKNSDKPLKKLVKNSQTPGGLNWQGLMELKKTNYYKNLDKILGKIYKRLNKS